MSELAHLLEYLLASIGLTVLLVWPASGPGAFIRDRVIRPVLPGGIKNVLDCYICLGFWSGLLLSGLAWWLYREPSCWLGCLMTPGMFWIVLKNPNTHEESSNKEAP